MMSLRVVSTTLAQLLWKPFHFYAVFYIWLACILRNEEEWWNKNQCQWGNWLDFGYICLHKVHTFFCYIHYCFHKADYTIQPPEIWYHHNISLLITLIRPLLIHYSRPLPYSVHKWMNQVYGCFHYGDVIKVMNALPAKALLALLFQLP